MNVLKTLLGEVTNALEFLEHGLTIAKETYEKKLEKSHLSDDLLMQLAWDVVGFEQLINQGNEIEEEVSSMVDDMRLGLASSVILQLQRIEKKVLQYYKGLYSKKRTLLATYSYL